MHDVHTWHAVICTKGTALPTTYNAIVWSTDLVVADDSFTVNSGAIPELPTVLGALVDLLRFDGQIAYAAEASLVCGNIVASYSAGEQ